MNSFAVCTGLCLGAIIIFCSAKMLSFPRMAVLLFVSNSFIGSVALLSLEAYLFSKGIYITIPPLGAVGVGILGIPGAIVAWIISLL